MTIESRRSGFQNVWVGVGGVGVVLLVAASLTPNLLRTRVAPPDTYIASTRSTAVSPSTLKLYSSAEAERQGKGVVSTAGHVEAADADHKLVRTVSMDATAQNPAETAEGVRAAVAKVGGYVEHAQIVGNGSRSSASITIRVPAVRLEQARAEIRNLNLHVENESTEAADVTRQYVDAEARIRNLRAQEAQYLLIMKSAVRIKDLLEVSDKLSEVRSEIEQQQAEFQALSHQVETVALSLSLRAQSDTELLGISWRPIYRIKVAARDALDNLADYGAFMIGIIFELPVAFLWLATIVVAIAAAWRGYTWLRVKFFSTPKPASAVS